MAKFKFSLETVLKVDKLRKKQVKTEFARAQEYLARQHKVLSDMHEEMSLIAADMTSMAIKGATVNSIKMYADYTQVLRQRIRQQEQIVKRAEKQVEEIMERLVSLMKKTNVLSQLKEQQYRDYIAELEKKQQKAIDEFTGFKLFQQGGALDGQAE